MPGISWEKSGDIEALKTLWGEVRKTQPSLNHAARLISKQIKGRSQNAVREKLTAMLEDGEIEDLARQDMDIEAAREAVTVDATVKRHKDDAKTWKKRYEEVLEELAFQDKMLSFAKEMIAPLPPIKPAAYRPKVKGKESPQSDILNISDWHLGETISGEEMRGINEYSFAIAKKRYQYLVETVLDIRRAHHAAIPVKALHVNLLGDMATGVLHDKPEYAEGTILERVFIGAALIAQGLRDFAAYYPHVHVRGVPGNEARMTIGKKYRGRYVNWDTLLYHVCRLYLKDQENIEWEIPQSFFTMATIEGKEHLLYHGDDIRSWMNLPFYGIQRAVSQFTQLQQMQDAKLDYIHLGHFHQATTLPSYRGEIFVNGSGLGTDEFAFVALRAAGPPSQWYLGAHPEKGISWRYRIDLSFADEITPRYEGSLTENIQRQLEEMGL